MTFSCPPGLLQNPPLREAATRAARSLSPSPGQCQSLGTRQALGSMVMAWKWDSAPAVCCPSSSAPAAAQGGGREFSSQSPCGCSRGAQTLQDVSQVEKWGKPPVISPWCFLGTGFLPDFEVFIRQSIPSSATHSQLGVHILHLGKSEC